MNASARDSAKAQIDALLDKAPIGRFQIRVAILCGIIAMLDGFDTQAIAFVAPSIGEAWGLGADKIGLIFAAGLLGIMVGQVTLGMLSDRWGRRPVILFCVVLFGVFSLITPLVDNWVALLLLRFLTGLGLGGATPNLISLVAEVAPPRSRATMVTTMFAGFPLGAALGAYASSFLIPALGWQSVFVIGGVLPLLLLPVLYLWLAESPYQLLLQGKGEAAVNQVLFKITGKKIELAPASELVQPESQSKPKPSYRLLFTGSLAKVTLPLWVAYFNSLLMIYFLMSWLPTIARQSGLALDISIISSVFLNIGGAIGGIVLGRFADRLGSFRTLAVGYAVAGVSLVLIGQFTGQTAVLMSLVFIAGLFTIGGQTAMNAATVNLYPAEVRATALGAALAVGRVGSILGPTLGGLLLASSWQLSTIFALVAVPAFATTLLAIMLSRLSPSR